MSTWGILCADDRLGKNKDGLQDYGIERLEEQELKIIEMKSDL